MAKQQTVTKPDRALRARTKKFLTKPGPELDKVPLTEIQALVRELQLHQVELDMQNEELRRSQAEIETALANYADLYDSAPNGYFTFNPQGIILKANLTGGRLLGVERGSLRRTSFLPYVVPEFRAEFRAHLHQVFATQARQFCTLQLASSEGAPRHVTLESIAVPTNEKGRPCQCRSAVSDLSATRESMADLSRMNARLKGLVEEADKRNHELTLVNSMAEKLQSRLSLDEAYPLIAQHAQAIFPLSSGALFIHDPTSDKVEAVSIWGNVPPGEPGFSPRDCWALRRRRIHMGGKPCRELLCHRPPGAHPEPHLCLPLLAQGEAVGLLHIQSLKDFTPERMEPLKTLTVTVGDHISLALANIRLRETLRHQVVHDVLTGLFNRRYLEETLEREIFRGRRKGASLGLIMLDLDHFKGFNDTYGHEAGDNLLHTLGKFLSERVRREDVACRYGGEEFVLILAEASREIVCQRAEEIRREFPKVPVLYRGRLLRSVTTSVGVAMFPEHGLTGRDVLRAADDAMYRAKAQGRNRVLVAEGREHCVPESSQPDNHKDYNLSPTLSISASARLFDFARLLPSPPWSLLI